ncbi:MAG: hypothetical protein FI698_00245 [SAR202 cluster bacterium]|nr:hypothetical protein [SAR202 cluster bacterium]
MKLRDWINLTGIYLAIFGLKGILLLMDRAARRILPPQTYCYTWKSESETLPNTLNIVTNINSELTDYEKLFTSEKGKIIAAANRILKREFQIASLGWIDFGGQVDWHRDPKTKHEWSGGFYSQIDLISSFDLGTDIKVTWELSRFHQALILARAYWLTGETIYRQDLIDHWADWVENNPFPYGIHWTSSMEVSIRAVNMILALLIIADKDKNTNSIPNTVFQNIIEHGKYITRNLEISSKNGKLIAGNHLISNYSALVIIGLFLSDIPLAQEWLKVGMRGLNIEVERQVLPDGLHYESSLHYHKFVLEMLLITGVLANNQGHEMPLKYKESVSKMCDAVVVLTRPDGELPMIGDADGGTFSVLSGYYLNRPDNNHDILALGAIFLDREDLKCISNDSLAELFWLTGSDNVSSCLQASEPFLFPECVEYKNGGICVLQNRDRKDFILFRTGWPENESPTGHRHNDLLSIEIWLNGKPITVDPGTLTYTADFCVRNELRSNKSHGTVTLNNAEQNLIQSDSPFELVPKTNSGDVHITSSKELITVKSSAIWSSLMSHQRLVSYSVKSGALIIEDTIKEADTACWSWPLFPGVNGFKAIVSTDLKLSETIDDLKYATSYGLADNSRIVRFSSDTKQRASVKFLFNQSKDSAKALSKDSSMVL